MQGDVTLRPKMDGTPEMYTSSTEPGEAGSLICQIVGDDARNNGLVFIGDTMGLSPAAQIRRTEAMLSSALRWGMTAHLRPHQLQLDPEVAGVRKLDWQGNDSHNLRELAATKAERHFVSSRNCSDSTII